MKRIFFILIVKFISIISVAQTDLNLASMIGTIDSSNIFISNGWYSWCPSVVEGEDGRYYMFYSRWPHGTRKLDDDTLNYIFNGFAGWMKYSEIACAVSDKLDGPYKYVKTILKGTGEAGRWDRFTMHNPHIRKFDGNYYLYYISNSYDSNYAFKKTSVTKADRERLQWMKYNASQAIGVLKASSIKDMLAGNYAKPAGPIMQVDNKQTFEVVNNPSVDRGPDGRYYMMYKSRTKEEGNGRMTFWMAVADKPDAVFNTISNVINDPEMSSEDPCMWYDKNAKCFYAVAKYFSQSLKYAPEFGSLILIQSNNGKDWALARHTLVSLKKMQFKDGRQVKLDRLERPFVYLDKNGKPRALFAAAAIQPPQNGDPLHITNETNSFNICFPLK